MKVLLYGGVVTEFIALNLKESEFYSQWFSMLYSSWSGKYLKYLMDTFNLRSCQSDMSILFLFAGGQPIALPGMFSLIT